MLCFHGFHSGGRVCALSLASRINPPHAQAPIAEVAWTSRPMNSREGKGSSCTRGMPETKVFFFPFSIPYMFYLAREQMDQNPAAVRSLRDRLVPRQSESFPPRTSSCAPRSCCSKPRAPTSCTNVRTSVGSSFCKGSTSIASRAQRVGRPGAKQVTNVLERMREERRCERRSPLSLSISNTTKVVGHRYPCRMLFLSGAFPYKPRHALRHLPSRSIACLLRTNQSIWKRCTPCGLSTSRSGNGIARCKQ